MKIIFEKTDLPKNENFREGLATLLKSFGYKPMWSSTKTLELFELGNVYRLPERKTKVHTLRLGDKLIIANGFDPLMYVDLAKRELHKYEDEASE